MVYLVKPRRWSDFYFGLSWFWRGQYEEPIPPLKRLMEAPLPAHTIGSVLAALPGWLIFELHGWQLWGFIVMFHLWWQFNNLERRAYGDPPHEAVGQVFWRLLIGAVSAALLVWWLW